MTELSANSIAETTYDNTITYTGPFDNGSTQASVADLDLLDLTSFSWRLYLDVTLGSGPVDALVRDHTTNTHSFSNVDDILLGSVSDDDVTVSGTPALGYQNSDHVPVIDAGAGSNQDLLIIAAGALSASFQRYELNMETGLLTGHDDTLGTASFGRYMNFNWLSFYAENEVTVQGTSGADSVSIFGNAQAIVNTGGGKDWIVSGPGDEIIDGGDDFDMVSYAEATGGVAVYLLYTGRNVGGGRGKDHLTNVEDLTGSNFDDRLIGDHGSNYIYGGAGIDVIKGKGGDDLLSGQDGADRIRGDDGNDSVYGGTGSDTLLGDEGNDLVSGNEENDFLYGGRGDDTIYGGDGNDRLRGNRNNDELNGGAGEDTLFGGGNNDTLNGNDGNDRLIGENGNDRLDGGAGDDVLTGGAGVDQFVYNLTGTDRVKDFEDGIDQLDLSGIDTLTTFADVSAVALDQWGGVVLDFGNDNILFLENTNFADFDASDVIL